MWYKTLITGRAKTTRVRRGLRVERLQKGAKGQKGMLRGEMEEEVEENLWITRLCT